MDNIGDLCHVTFPWIAGQAIRLGIETKDNSFAQLGYHLVLLSQSFPLSSLVESPQLVQIVHLVNKACSVSRNGNDGPSRPYHILLRVSEIQKSRLAADRALANDVQQGLAQFVSLKNPEYPSLLRLITEFLGKQDLPSESSKEQIVTWGANDRPHAQVNNALYNQLRIYSTCSCNTRHLEDARLRLDSDQTSWNHALVQFNLLFAASPSHCPESHPQPRWKEGRVLVARDDRSHQKKRVVFSDVDTELPLTTLASSPPPSSTRKIGLGELCKLIQSEGSSSVHLEIRDNAMKLNENIEYTSHRHFPPQASVPLAKWLEQTSHISNRVKVTLAYIIAKSVWQYYDSNWMRKPWTNESIQIIKETIQDRKQSQPHPYFTTTLSKPQGQMLDYYTADNICHMFPSILALGVILVEIGIKRAFQSDNMQSVLNETTINEYYEWAWMTANATNLGETIGPIYEKAINHCLDGELFRDCPIDTSLPGNELEARQDLLYEKVVLPLQELYCAYKDDWDIQENPIQDPTAQETQQPKQVSFRLTGRPQFSIAIFCALPLEATAVNDIFDDVWNEERENSWRSAGDENTYTFGRIVCYNVVLVHMGDMGKNAASQATAGIKASYPEIKLALIVGICGGVPTYSTADKDEMILGDIVISDGIVRYDFGKQFPDTYMSRAAPEVVALPNHRVRGILAKLKGERVKERMERRISQHVQALQDELGTRGSVYVGTDRDELFHPSYPHKHQDPDVCAVCNIKGSERVCEKARTMSCDELGCEKSSLTPRKRLYEASMGGCTPKPKIHFGHVGSGDTVMKSGQHRDKTASPWKLVAFEMEASGVWDMLPCLVIKGVCDYSDSHKNKSWQEYAATTAAACVRAVLEEYVIAQ